MDEVISRLPQLGEVQTATPNRVIKRAYREDRKAYPVSQRMLERSAVTRVSGDYAYNDVLLPWQWHIINRGYRDNFVIGDTDGKTVEEVQAKYRAGADVNCEKAWERTTGDPSIVVAVLDEGSYVYVELSYRDGNTFTIYQNLDSFGPRRITGSYSLYTDDALGAVIRGMYDYENGDWASRYVIRDLYEDRMTWIAVGDETNVSEYVRCEAVPEEILLQLGGAEEE